MIRSVDLSHVVSGQTGFAEDALDGLTSTPKQVPCKYFYDRWGSQLFEEICGLPEYYVTRTELAIMRASADEIVSTIGHDSLLIEYGSGSSLKTRILLDHAQELTGYVPVDISREQLECASRELRARYPRLRISPVCADYTREYELPIEWAGNRRRIVYFPGSTIGNFDPQGAIEFLRHIAEVCGPDGALLIGVDLKKDPRLLAAAYNDSSGVTAAFNLNLLSRMNRELGTDFRLRRYSHYAPYNPCAGRVEMHLVSLDEQVVHLCGQEIPFGVGESIWTENSYKYSLSDFERLAHHGGFTVRHVWTDPERLFSIHYLTVSDERGNGHECG